MGKRISISELITSQDSFRRASKVMELQMKQAGKLSKMLQKAQARMGALAQDEEPLQSKIADFAPFDQGL